MNANKMSWVCLLVASLATAAEPTMTKEATGQAAISKGDEAKAYDEALKQPRSY